MTSIKNCNSVANLRKTIIYDTNIDVVNDNVYTKFGNNRYIRFQDIEQKLNSDDDPRACFFYVFSYYKSMEANDPRGVANLDPRGMIGRIYEGYH